MEAATTAGMTAEVEAGVAMAAEMKVGAVPGGRIPGAATRGPGLAGVIRPVPAGIVQVLRPGVESVEAKVVRVKQKTTEYDRA